MSMLYFTAIYNTKEKAYAIMKETEKNFEKFNNYLNSAIASQEKRKVSSKWKPADMGKKVQLSPIINCLEIKQRLEFEWKDSWYEVSVLNGDVPKSSEKLTFVRTEKFVKPEEYQLVTSDTGTVFINLNFIPFEDETIIWGEKTFIKLRKFTLDKNKLSISQQRSSSVIQLDSISEDKENCIYSASFSGSIDPEIPLIVNGFIVKNWKLISTDKNSTFYVDEKPLDIIKREGSLFYTRMPVRENSVLTCGGISINFQLKKLSLPQKVKHKENILDVLVEDGQVKLYGETKDMKTGDKVTDYNNALMEFAVSIESEKVDPYTVWIELMDDEEYPDDGSIFQNSSIDYFFSEDVSELEGNPENPSEKQKKFCIDPHRNKEERLLKLRRRDNQPLSYEYLPKILYISINTHQLKMQKDAIKSIKERPLVEHKYLLALTEKKDDNNPWQRFEPDKPEQWYVLKDKNRDGTESQRNFVRKAIATPDFVLLEGPPGSGKTTAILELIIQLAKMEKRILLSASTHVAIDNVLEKLQEIDCMNFMFPLRIGREDVIADSIKKYSIDNVANESSEYRRIIVDAANLVCGTTIGILQHPNFKDHSKDEPIVPEFDYLIIDESSKTTFQEFLVPALHAKKWILVGDVKQLSPYTETDHLVACLENYSKKMKFPVFGENLQKACLIIWKYLCSPKEKDLFDSKYCIVEKDEVIDTIKKEIKARYDAKSKGITSELLEKVAFLEKVDKNNDCYKGILNIVTLQDCVEGKPTSWLLPGFNVLFAKESELKKFKKYIPSNMHVLFRTDWELESQQFKMAAYYGRVGNRNNSEKNSNSCDDVIKKNNEFFREKRWASEVIWRTIRLHELRESQKNIDWILKDIDNLLPELDKDNVLQIYEEVKDIALPSILESLKKGVGKKNEKDNPTVLNSGFKSDDLNLRYECLDFQHRMHPEISAFPREQFYSKEGALKDAASIDREWSYSRYPSRSIWIDVNGKTYRGSNDEEATTLIKEVEAFVEWAKYNPKADGKPWTVACLTFYKGQERKIKDRLRKFPNCSRRNSQFEKEGVTVLLYTIDKFQGREADITIISMVQTKKDGFLDSPNRLNVAITRARYQQVIIGKKPYFLKSNSKDLKALAQATASLNEEGKK